MIATVLAALTLIAVVPASARAEPPFEKARIPHRDGSGRATVVEIDPKVPGARDFVDGTERPAPARGELSLPSPTPLPTSTPGAHPACRP